MVLDLQQPAHRDTEPVRAILRALRENSAKRPVFAPARMPRAAADLGRIDAVEEINDLDMGKSFETEQRGGLDFRKIELDTSFDSVPAVVDRLAARASDKADGADGEFDRLFHRA